MAWYDGMIDEDVVRLKGRCEGTFLGQKDIGPLNARNNRWKAMMPIECEDRKIGKRRCKIEN
jgi:hypothetical protein